MDSKVRKNSINSLNSINHKVAQCQYTLFKCNVKKYIIIETVTPTYALSEGCHALPACLEQYPRATPHLGDFYGAIRAQGMAALESGLMMFL